MSWDRYQPSPEALALLDRVTTSLDLLAPSAPSIGGSALTAQKPLHVAVAPQQIVRDDTLSSFENACATACTAVDSALSLLDELDARHVAVAGKTSALHDECRSLAEEEHKARDLVEKIARPLSYFDSLYVLGTRLGLRFDGAEAAEATVAVAAAQAEYQRLLALHSSGGLPSPTDASAPPSAHAAAMRVFPHRVTPSPSSPLTPFDPEFPAALDRIDECIGFLASHASFKDATGTLTRYRQLQAHALGLVQAAAREAVERAASGAAAEVKRALAAPTALSAPPLDPQALEGLLTSQLQLRFRGELGHLRRLVGLVEARAASRRSYADLVRAIHAHYLDRRLALVGDVARARLARIVEERAPAPGLASPRAGATAGVVVAGAGGPHPPPGDAPAPGSELDGAAATAAAPATAPKPPPHAHLHGVIDPGSYRREAHLVEAVRSASSSMARMAQGEHALFHALFIAAAPGAGAGSGAGDATSRGGAATSRGGADAPTPPTSRAGGASGGGAGGVSRPSMPSHVRAAADAALSSMQEELCCLLPDALRPLLLQCGSLDVLAEVVTLLREEVVGELAAPRGPVLAPLARVVLGLVRDVQERLIFRAQGYIASDQVAGFSLSGAPNPSAAATHSPSSSSSSAVSHAVSVPLSLADGSRGVVRGVTVRGPADYPGVLLAHHLRARTGSPPPPLSDSWYPVLDRVLGLLGKLHPVLEPASFDALAQDALAACSGALIAAGAAIRANSGAFAGGAPDAYAAARLTLVAGEGGASQAPTQPLQPSPGTLIRGLAAGCIALGGPPASTSALDGDLFVIKSLLTLREQLSPLAGHVSLAHTAKSLDFSSTTGALAALLRSGGRGGGGSSLFSLSRDNPVLSLVASGRYLPTVSESTVDAKAELEGLLKAACEGFIARCRAVLIVAPLEALLGRHPLPQPSAPRPPGSASSAASAFAADACATLDGLLASSPPLVAALRRRLGLYLGSPVTATILFKPVREAVAGALTSARAHAYELFSALVAEAGAAAGAPGDQQGALASAARERAWVEARLGALGRLMEASDQLAVDPLAPAFGYDDVLLPGALAAGHPQGGASLPALGVALPPAGTSGPQQPRALPPSGPGEERDGTPGSSQMTGAAVAAPGAAGAGDGGRGDDGDATPEAQVHV